MATTPSALVLSGGGGGGRIFRGTLDFLKVPYAFLRDPNPEGGGVRTGFRQ